MGEGIETMAEEIFRLNIVEFAEDAKVDAIVCHFSLVCSSLAEVFNCPMIIFNPGVILLRLVPWSFLGEIFKN